MTERHGVFLTGTDTGVGKTLIACAITKALGSGQRSVGVYKPVETGCPPGQEAAPGSDCRLLLSAAGNEQDGKDIAAYRLEQPAAPLVAAEQAGTRIVPDLLLAGFERLRRRYDLVVVEGAGGLMVPLAEGFTYLDLTTALGLPVLLCIGSRLGCINHALLSLKVLREAGCPIAGYVINTLEEGAAAAEAAASNRRVIGRFAPERCLGTFPFVAGGTRAAPGLLGRLAARHLELEWI